MAYAYADWIAETDLTARETALRNHMAEVEALIVPDLSSGGKSRSNATLEAKLARLQTQLDKLVAINARASGSSVTYARKR